MGAKEGPELSPERAPEPPQPQKFLHFLLLRNQSEENLRKIHRIMKYTLIASMVTTTFFLVLWRQWPEDRSVEGMALSRIVPKLLTRRLAQPCQLSTGDPTVTCRGINLSDNISLVIEALQNAKNQNFQKIKIELLDVIFPDNIIRPGWLPLNSSVPTVTHLTIGGRTIQQLEDHCFVEFIQLEALTLKETNIRMLTKNVLEGLNSLTELNLLGNTDLKGVEEGLLKKSRITTLQLQQMDLSDYNNNNLFFQNLTGENVQIFDLQQNGLHSLTSAILAGYTSIQSLYLQENKIETFEQSTFNKALRIKQIYLQVNAIRDVPQKTFGALVEKGTVIYLKDNPLNCTCDLVWLRDYIRRVNDTSQQRKAFDNVTCITPDNLYNVQLLDADMCPDDSTTPATLTESTTTQSTTTTTADPPATTDSNGPTTEEPREKCDEVTEFTLHLGSEKSKFSIDESKSSGNEVVINSQDTIYPIPLIWFCTNCGFTNCTTIKESNAVITGLTAETEYVFCLYDNTTSSQRECLAHQTRPEPYNEPWLVMADVPYTLAGVTAGFVVMLVVGGFMSYWIVRRRPTLLKGSGRVEVVKARDGDVVLVMPSDMSSKGSTRPASSVYDTISGYVSVNGSQSPPPLPPYPPGWPDREKGEEHVYIEPQHIYNQSPRNKDLLIEYEWYTSQQIRRSSEASSSREE